MKIYGLVGSLNKKGNTVNLVKQVIFCLERKLNEYGINSIIKVKNVNDYEICQCISCMKCFCGEKCVLKDELYQIKSDFLNNDIIILSTPIYLNFISGSLKILFDRLAYWSHLLPLIGKKAILVITTSNSGVKQTEDYLELICAYFGLTVITTIVKTSKEIDELNYEVSELITNEAVERILNNMYKSPKLEIVFNYYYNYYLNLIDDTKEKEYWIKRYLKYADLEDILASIQQK